MKCDNKTGLLGFIVFTLLLTTIWLWELSVNSHLSDESSFKLFFTLPLILIVNVYISYKAAKLAKKYFTCVKLWIFSAILFVLLSAHFWALNNFYGRGQNTGLCGSNVLYESYSPNKTKKAIVFTFDCGATTDFNTLVAIADANDSLYDTPISYDVYWQNHKRELRINWLSDTKLEIIDPLPRSKEPFRNNANGVQVLFK